MRDLEVGAVNLVGGAVAGSKLVVSGAEEVLTSSVPHLT